MARFKKMLIPQTLRHLALLRRSQVKNILHENNPEKIIAYVRSNIIPAAEGRKCVDGRYLPDQGRGMIGRPGGDCGYVMALDAINNKKKLGLTPEECFNIVYKAIVKNGSKFGMHTDDHAHKGNIGCGHLQKASNKKFAKGYDINCTDVAHIISYACNISEISTDIDMVQLHGNHEEKGVLIVQSDTYTVLADNPQLHQMYFIYDEKRDSDFLKKLLLEIHLPEISYTEMKYELDLQLQATLQNLALGLPIYTVTFNGKNPVVEFKGFVIPKRAGMKLRMRLSERFSPQLLLQVFHR